MNDFAGENVRAEDDLVSNGAASDTMPDRIISDERGRAAAGRTTRPIGDDRDRPGRAPPTPLFPWQHPSQAASEAAMVDHVSAADFPCVGAKAALAKGTLSVLACKAIDSAWDDVRIHDALSKFAADYRAEPGMFRSLAVTFDGPTALSEDAFEDALWSRLQSLSDKDVWRGHGYDGTVSSDPSNPHFSLSFGGEAFFVVGLHPNASRPARRFAQPALVFNLHDQFERLRAEGRYETMREKILVRDEALAGSRNPMLARHGDLSEARQYSGRSVGEEWTCPFAYRGAAGDVGVQASAGRGGSDPSAASASERFARESGSRTADGIEASNSFSHRDGSE